MLFRVLIPLWYLIFLPNAFSEEHPTVTSAEISKHIEEGIFGVDEFNFIQKEAEARGFRAWLFGGTASGYGRYAKQDLLRKKGDVRFQQSDRFDHHFTNIYRSSQYADIVIDGTPAQAAELEAALAAKYPHLKGKKSVWEVRLLREKINDKLPLLGDPSFQNQHTDSNSLGMIEITKPPVGESVVKDLRHWSNEHSDFLDDLTNDSIHYYFSELHGATERALLGKNPTIMSVARFLTKVNQGDLQISPEDDKIIRKLSDEFDPKGPAMQNEYVRN